MEERIKARDIQVGMKFGLLTTVEKHWDEKRSRARWDCVCECGNMKNVRADNLANGSVISCGCMIRDKRRVYNEYDMSGDYGIGYTSNTHVPFYFDKKDYELIKNYTWQEDTANHCIKASINRKNRRLHNLLVGGGDGGHSVKHINGNNYDNRRENLRVAGC